MSEVMRVWQGVEDDLIPISIGAGILGPGGGGNPYLGYLRVRESIRAGAVFALKDRISWLVVACVAVVFVIASGGLP